jgi:hypothetical protein
MSQNDLVEAYRRGRISRRTFIRGMVALGATMTMANRAADTYAAPQRPAGAAASRAQDDVYGDDDDGAGGGTTGGGTTGGSSSGGGTTGGSSSGGSSSGGGSGRSTLPRTGIGSSPANGSWLKPATLVAGAAALAVAGLRRLKGSEADRT